MRFSGPFTLLATLAACQSVFALPVEKDAHVSQSNSTDLIDLEERGTGLRRGFGWVGDQRFVPGADQKGTVNWYHYWENMPMDNMRSAGIPYVPMFWGQKKIAQWRQVEKTFDPNNLPKYILAQNEPDIITQAAEDPYSAAWFWLNYLAPYQYKGVQVSSPAIVYNTGWLETFMKNVKFFGKEPDFIQLHYYGPWWSINEFKTYITGIHDKYGKDIWVTEYGVRADSNPTEAQAIQFMKESTRWMETQPYIKRAAWFGAYSRSAPPDKFTSKWDAMWLSNGQKTRAGRFWIDNV